MLPLHAGVSSMAALVLFCAMTLSENAGAKDQVVPVFDRCEVLVVDSSLAGCITAWELAHAGRDVVLASADASIPHEIAVSLRLWAATRRVDPLPPAFRQVLTSASTGKTEQGEQIYNVAHVCEAFEDLLIEAGVRFYYGVTPCGIVRNDGKLSGVVFAGKFGLGTIAASAVIDCSGRATVAAMAGAQIVDRHPGEPEVEMACCMVYEGAHPPGTDVVVAGCDELVDHKIVIHGPVAEFRMRAVIDFNDPLYPSRSVVESRRILAEAVRCMDAQDHAHHLVFSRTPDRLLIAPTVRIRSARHHTGSWRAAQTDEQRADLCRPDFCANLWVCSATLDVDNSEADALNDPWQAVAIGRALAAVVSRLAAEYPPMPPDQRLAATISFDRGKTAASSDLALAFGDLPPLHGGGMSVRLASHPLPELAECDVLVVGGGTSGVPAALTAAQEGMRVILVEKHSDLGGTHTIGGVSSYWYGRDTSFRKKLDRGYAELTRLGLPQAMSMTEVLRQNQVTVLPKCPAAGVLMAGSTVRGVAVATPAGLAVIRAGVVIDATGDGDIAAWSGAEYEYGSGRDAMTIWCSFGEFKREGTAVSRQYDSVVDLRDPADYTRAIITGRRRVGIFGTGTFPQHYLTVRESRRIHGRETVTYGGILAGQKFTDLVLLCRSNFDIKGIASSDLARCGYISFDYEENFTAAVPFAALLPKSRENLLVIGKAYSITHDALSLARMQRDLMAMGGVAGLAAGSAVKEHRAVSQVDVASLQSQLVGREILSQADLEDWRRTGSSLDETGVEQMITRLLAGKIDLPGKVALLMQGKQAQVALRLALDKAETEQAKVEIARALCYLKDATGVPILLEAIRQQTQKELPKAKDSPHKQPDHGWAPEPAYLIYAVGLTRDPRLVPVLESVAQKIVIAPNTIDAHFEYVMAICQAAERSGAKEMIPVLENLAKRPSLQGLTLRYGEDPRKSLSVDGERQAYLELSIGRALARCGSADGYRVLIRYLSDMRGFLARSAHDELTAIVGNDLGYRGEAWVQWLEREGSSLPSKPYRDRIR